MTTLPDKPSELIELALEDLRSVEQDPRFTVEMEVWVVRRTNDTCAVCLAGAVMARRFVMSDEGRVPYPEACGSEAAKLYALDKFRAGLLCQAYKHLEREKPDGVPDYVQIWPYHLDKDLFHRDMDRLVTLLKEHGG